MNRLFGKKKDVPKPTLDDASKRLGERTDAIESRVGKIDAELIKLKELIQRSSGMTQQRYKQKAMQLLKQKKMYENQQGTLMQQQFNMDQLQFTTESVKDTKIQLDAMKVANKTLKKEMKKVNLDDVENMQDELRELYEDTQEVQEAMGRSYEVNEYVDEDEMMNELNALTFDMEKEKEADYLAEALSLPEKKLPTVATTDIKIDSGNEKKSDLTSLETQLGL